MSIHVTDENLLEAIAYLRCFHDKDDAGIQGFEGVDFRTLSLVLAGLVLVNVVSEPCERPELWLDQMTQIVRRRSGTDVDGIRGE